MRNPHFIASIGKRFGAKSSLGSPLSLPAPYQLAGEATGIRPVHIVLVGSDTYSSVDRP